MNVEGRQPGRLRIPITILLLLAASLPWVIEGSRQVECSTAGLDQWLPLDHPDRVLYESFVRRFGSDDLVIVSWDDCTLDDPRLEQFANAVDKSPAEPSEIPSLFARLVTGKRHLHQLMAAPFSLSREDAVSRLEGFLVGSDRRTTCAIVLLTDAGRQQPRTAVLKLRSWLKEIGIEAASIHLGGTAYEAASIGDASEHTLHSYTVPVTVVTTVIALVCLRSLALLVTVGLTAAYCRFLTMAMVYYLDMQLSAVLIVAPILVYVLTMSGAVHLVNYFRDAVAENHPQPALAAVKSGWKPCTLATVSTAIGLASLGISHTAPIREFGVYSAVCLMISLVIMLAVVPSVLSIWYHFVAVDSKQNAWFSSDWLTETLPTLVVRHHRMICASAFVITSAAGLGLWKLHSTVQFRDLFHEDAPLVRNYSWLEQNIGPLGAVEVLVTFTDTSPRTRLQRLDLLRDIDDRIAAQADVVTTVSAVSLLPDFQAGGLSGLLAKSVARQRLQNALPLLQQESLLSMQRNAETWRISARISTMNRIDYQGLTAGMRRTAESVIQEQSAQGNVDCTGLLPMVEVAQRQLLTDLIHSFATAFLLICPVMMVLLRSFVAGFISMLPNVLPIVIVFGVMGWMGYPVDVGALLTASVALGIAVDDTLHFLKWFREQMQTGSRREAAIRESFRRCAPAMVQTTLICGVGLLLLIDSSFVPTQRFAVLLFLLLFCALPGDLLLLPALLAGRTGRFFEPMPPATDSCPAVPDQESRDVSPQELRC